MKDYDDEISLVCREIVEDGHKIGIISNAEMREFEEDDLVPASPSMTETGSSLKRAAAPAFAEHHS